MIDDPLRRPGCDVAWHEIAECRVLPLQVVVAVGIRDLVWWTRIVRAQRYPDAPVVAKRFGHQGELRLELIARGDAGGVDLGEARVGEERPLAMRPPDRCCVAVHGVCREEVDVRVATGGQDDGMGRMAGDLARHQVAHHDPSRPFVLGHELEHFGSAEHLDPALGYLAFERLVGREQQLLAGLAAGVEGASHLSASEGAVVEQAAVLPGIRRTLGNGLVDDLVRHLGQPIHVGLAGAEVAALHGVVEQAEDAVVVVRVVLGRVDPALGSDGMGPSG